MHFLIEASFAAPESALPSALLALSVQHFVIALVLAAPYSGLPSALMALQASANAGEAANMLRTTRTDNFFMGNLQMEGQSA